MRQDKGQAEFLMTMIRSQAILLGKIRGRV